MAMLPGLDLANNPGLLAMLLRGSGGAMAGSGSPLSMLMPPRPMPAAPPPPVARPMVPPQQQPGMNPTGLLGPAAQLASSLRGPAPNLATAGATPGSAGAAGLAPGGGMGMGAPEPLVNLPQMLGFGPYSTAPLAASTAYPTTAATALVPGANTAMGAVGGVSPILSSALGGAGADAAAAGAAGAGLGAAGAGAGAAAGGAAAADAAATGAAAAGGTSIMDLLGMLGPLAFLA